MAHHNIGHYWRIIVVLFACCQIDTVIGDQPRPQKSRVSIVGGTISKVNAWPMNAIVYTSDGFLCGGTVIAPRWILTAAHCIEDNDEPTSYRVIVGKSDRSIDIHIEDLLRPEKIFKHPNYIASELGDDIGLIYLPNPLQYSEKVQQVALSTESDDPAPGSKCTVIGFGTTTYKGDSSNQLRQVDLPIVSNEDCGVMLGRKIWDNWICAGETGKDSCQGDSGGPLLCKNANQQFQVAGVVNFGTGCGQEGKPGLYARVSNYLEWIDETMKSLSN